MLPSLAKFGLELEGHGELPEEWLLAYRGRSTLQVPELGREKWDVGGDGSLSPCGSCQVENDCEHGCDSDCMSCVHEHSIEDADCRADCGHLGTGMHIPDSRAPGSSHCIQYCECEHDCFDYDECQSCIHECGEYCMTAPLFEIRTPPLLGEAGLSWVTKSVIALANSVHVATDCGLHVHLDYKAILQAAGKSPESEADLIDMARRVRLAYRRCWEGICQMVEEDRRSNDYCSYPEGVQDIHSFSDLGSQNRHQAVNLGAIDKYRTIEFRQHQGCFEPIRIAMWVRFLWDFAVSAADGAPSGRLNSLEEVLDYAKVSNDVREFYLTK